MSDEFGFADFTKAKQYESQSKNASTVGYGDTVLESDEVESFQPGKANLNLIDEQDCRSAARLDNDESFIKILNQYLNYDNMLCGYNNQADTCAGDSGGPLYVDSEVDGIVLLGITSWGSVRQCQTRRGGQPPSVFTRVSVYIDWIITTMQNYSLDPTNLVKIDPTPTPQGEGEDSPKGFLCWLQRC
eukprot:TRINITY_DN36045_c0_g1_i1.p1 TRINITY_DN36045_c0_g1~~TRINITY_DN36045_c0_g1_i1.p1  ORF type:complete len:214 (-),score=29.32 TRINITY_DN36045_c0_g1_i1:68-628(-)